MFLEFSTHEWVAVLWKLVSGDSHIGTGLNAVSLRCVRACLPTLYTFCSLLFAVSIEQAMFIFDPSPAAKVRSSSSSPALSEIW